MMDERLDQPFITFQCLFGIRMSSQLDGNNYFFDFREDDKHLNLRNILRTDCPKRKKDEEINVSTIVIRGANYYMIIRGKEHHNAFYLQENTQVLVITINNIENPLKQAMCYAKYIDTKIICIPLVMSSSDYFSFDGDELPIQHGTFFHILMTCFGYQCIRSPDISLLTCKFSKYLQDFLEDVTVDKQTIVSFGDLLLPIVNHFNDLWNQNNQKRYDVLQCICEAENRCCAKKSNATKNPDFKQYMAHLFGIEVFFFFLIFFILF